MVIRGPSSHLPGSDLCDLLVDASSQRLCNSISDRKDCYHQIKVTSKRAICNTLGPGLPTSCLEGLQAYGNFLIGSEAKKRYTRLRDGNLLGQKRKASSKADDSLVWVAFNSILQGDHCGVDDI